MGAAFRSEKPFMEPVTIQQKIKNLQCCVIVPTYNNCKTLKRVLSGVLEYTTDVIVVNDGSTDLTEKYIADFPQVQTIHLPENRGKGNALRVAFAAAEAQGFLFAITIDSDGQHYPKDIPVFIKALEASENKEVLLIGARNMTQEGIPKKSSFGNKFSNFWFWVETGIWLQDTQSGYRLYPLKALKKRKYYTTKFEFEIEVIVKAAWSGVAVKNVPVEVLYDEKERVSHFRPFKDFTRISILNTWLVIVAIVYIKPRNLIRRIRKKGFRRFLFEDFLSSQDSPRKKALSIALGVFIGLSPLWGFHTIIVIFLAIFFKLNKVIAFAFSNVSLPPFIPFVVTLSFKIGTWVLGENYVFSFSEARENFEVLKHLKSYIIGSITLSVSAAILLGLLGFIFFSLFERKKAVV